MTEALYYKDPFLQEFTARVLRCTPAKDRYLVTLDRTAFYPEGGGQPADHGTLDGVAVTDVHERDGEIQHSCTAPLTEGASVHGRIDWGRRFDHMQQHSGEHLVSGLICERFHCDNVGFHMGAETVTIDFNADISMEDLTAIEQRANALIWANTPVLCSYPTAEELAALPYRSKKALSGAVRIVTIPQADCCACCGTHVKAMGQVGLVKFLSCGRLRDGVRIELLCGERAMRYLSGAWAQNLQIAQSLSAKPLESSLAVRRLQAELSAAKEHIARLEETAFASVAAGYAGFGRVLHFTEGLSADSLRRLCAAIGERCSGRCMVCSREADGFKYAICDETQDLRPVVKSLNLACAGRGGGKPSFVQGSVRCGKADLEAWWAEQD